MSILLSGPYGNTIMSFANNGARVKNVKYLKRAPTVDFGRWGLGGFDLSLTTWTLGHCFYIYSIVFVVLGDIHI